ncbi:MAG: PAS domain S-box protein [Deltaproteobacteria bacterium]|nr:PAS domain S-box protein [Deltaproteobacteria bacterium]
MKKQKEKPVTLEIDRLQKIVAEQEEVIEKLRVDNLFLETLFDGIDEEIMVLDADYRVLNVNRSFLERHGIDKDEAIGKKCYEVTYHAEKPCDQENRLCPLKKAAETGKRVEVTHRRDDGKSGAKEMIRIMYPLVMGGGEIKYFIEISRDVTEYRRLIRKLQASEKKFRTILDTATDAILSIDENQKIVLFNNAAQRIFGYTRKEILGKDLNVLVPPQYGDHRRFVKHFLEKKIPRAMGKTLSLTALRKNGEEFPIELGLSYLKMDQGITFTAIIRDVSEQKRLEENLLRSERLAAVGQAVAHVAHEIKNPLMIIGGFSHQIRNNLDDQKAVQKLDMIYDEISRLEKLVANLGDFTKEYRLVKRATDINSVIRDVLKIMAEIYQPEKYSFIEELSSNLVEIPCDPDKLKQVFMNIIANGIEAMEGGGSITISTASLPGGVEIRIADSGIGIEKDKLLHIFEPFYTTREKGSGLGLAISYKIVEAHKGDIWAQSNPGEGATFVIRLPNE